MCLLTLFLKIEDNKFLISKLFKINNKKIMNIYQIFIKNNNNKIIMKIKLIF